MLDVADKSITSPDDIKYPLINIESMSNEEYTPLIAPKVEETKKNDGPEIVNPPVQEQKEEAKFVCEQEQSTGELCDTQCKLCNQAQTNNISVEEQKNINQSAISETIENKEEAPSGSSQEAVKKNIKTLLDKGFELKNREYVKTIGTEKFGLPEDVIYQNDTSFNFRLNQALKHEEKLLKALEETKSKKEAEDPVIVDTNLTAAEAEEKISEEEDIEVETVVTENIEEFKEKAEEMLKESASDIEQPKVIKEIKEELKNRNSYFFSGLSSLGFQQLVLTVNKLEENKINVIVKPVNFSGDDAFNDIKPLTITGTPEELDNGFFDAIKVPMTKVHGLMTNAQSFLEEAKKKEAKTKAAKEKKDKIKKLIDAAKKYHDKEDFDANKTSSVNTVKKKWNAVLELDPKNKEGLTGLQKLRDQLSELNKTINFG